MARPPRLAGSIDAEHHGLEGHEVEVLDVFDLVRRPPLADVERVLEPAPAEAFPGAGSGRAGSTMYPVKRL
jgi:hypothetical protein